MPKRMLNDHSSEPKTAGETGRKDRKNGGRCRHPFGPEITGFAVSCVSIGVPPCV